MTGDKHQKAAARRRAKRTGESYAQARQYLESRRQVRANAGRSDPRARATEWIESTCFVAEGEPAPVIVPNPTVEQLESAAKSSRLAESGGDVQIVRRMRISESLVEVQLHTAHDVYFGIGLCEASATLAWYVTKRGCMPLVWLGALGEQDLDLSVQDGDLHAALDQALTCIGRAYQATDADNGGLVLSEMPDDLRDFVDGRGFDDTPWAIEDVMVPCPDHVVYRHSSHGQKVAAPGWYEGGVITSFDFDDEGQPTIYVLHADDPWTASEAVLYFHAACNFDRELAQILGADERYAIALAFCVAAECGVTALPLPVPNEPEEAAAQTLIGIHGFQA